MKRLKRLSPLLFTAALVSACVTINIYFPASQAEEAAEKIVDDILGKPVPKEGDKGAARTTETLFLAAAGALFDLVVPRAEAAAPDFNVDSPEIRRIQAQMKSRHQDLAPFYGTGAIGFDRDARVAIRDPQAVSLKDRNRLKQLVDAENRDRGALYAAIASANGHPEWEPQVRETFAGTWIKKASRGWWYQDASGRWQQK